MRFRNRFALCVLLALAGAGCAAREAPGGSTDIAPDKAAIDSVRNRYAATWLRGDGDSLSELYAPDAFVLYPNQPAIAGRDAIAAYFKSFFAEFSQDVFELTSQEIQVAGSWAFDRGTVRWQGTPRAGGEPLQDTGKYLVILQRQPDGSWRVARDMDNSDRPLAQNTRGE